MQQPVLQSCFALLPSCFAWQRTWHCVSECSGSAFSSCTSLRQMSPRFRVPIKSTRLCLLQSLHGGFAFRIVFCLVSAGIRVGSVELSMTLCSLAAAALVFQAGCCGRGTPKTSPFAPLAPIMRSLIASLWSEKGLWVELREKQDPHHTSLPLGSGGGQSSVSVPHVCRPSKPNSSAM